MNNGRYILDKKGNPKVCNDLLEWVNWFETSMPARRVAEDKVGRKNISTVFLGIDHSFGAGKPLLYETMIFPDEELFERYSTKRLAILGHKKCVKIYKKK
jgi:hypothetical protein